MSIMALIAFAYLARAISGPKFSDRILAVNGIQTIIILIICILSILQGENYIVDIALIYAMLGFVTVIIVCKAYLCIRCILKKYWSFPKNAPDI